MRSDFIKLEEKALLISRYIQEWLNINNKNIAKPGDVEKYLVDKGIYNKQDEERPGKFLRRDLRELRKRNLLYHIEGLEEVPKKVNSSWYFYKI